MLSSMADPYYEAKQEVEVGLKKARAMHDDWKRLLQSENTAQSKPFQDLHAQLGADLRSLDYDLQDITATINMVEENRAKFKFDDQEISTRKTFVKDSQKALKEMQESLTGRQAVSKIEGDKRQMLSGPSSSSSNDRSGQIRQENESFMARQRQEQVQIVAQQDEALTELSRSAQRLGETAKTINVELQDQQRMLEELDEDIDRETEKLNFVMKRIGRLLKTSDSKQLCVIIGLTVLLLVLLFLIINT